MAQRMCDSGHYASNMIRVEAGRLEREWKSLAAALEDRSTVLRMSVVFHKKAEMVSGFGSTVELLMWDPPDQKSPPLLRPLILKPFPGLQKLKCFHLLIVLLTPCRFMWGVSLICPMLMMSRREGSLHNRYSFTWTVFLMLILFCVVNFSYMPWDMLCGEFSWTPCALLRVSFLYTPLTNFMLGVSFTHPMLFYMGSFSSHTFIWGVFHAHTMLFLLGVSCTCQVCCFMYFLLHNLCSFMWGFLLNTPCCFIGVFFFFTHPILFYGLGGGFSYTPGVQGFSYTPHAVL